MIRIITTAAIPAGTGYVNRKLSQRNLKIDDLRNMLAVKYFFVGRTCTGGSPRFQISINKTGGNTHDANAFGYLGDQAFGGGCPADVWTYEDMTNDAPKWDISQLGGGMAVTWDAVEAFINTTYPDHRIVGCYLADDSGSFASTTIGTAYTTTSSVTIACSRMLQT